MRALLQVIHATMQRRSNHGRAGLNSIAVIARRNRGEEIHSWEGADQYWYRVISGGAKFFIVLPGGRRQILDLLMPNDLFGCLPQLGHYCALEAAVNDTVVACYPRKSAEILAESDPEIGPQVQKMVLDTIARSQELILIMGRTTAREKVGAFLLSMAERTSMPPGDRLMLLTSRYDIADYLALSVEDGEPVSSRSPTKKFYRACRSPASEHRQSSWARGTRPHGQSGQSWLINPFGV